MYVGIIQGSRNMTISVGGGGSETLFSFAGTQEVWFRGVS